MIKEKVIVDGIEEYVEFDYGRVKFKSTKSKICDISLIKLQSKIEATARELRILEATNEQMIEYSKTLKENDDKWLKSYLDFSACKEVLRSFDIEVNSDFSVTYAK